MQLRVRLLKHKRRHFNFYKSFAGLQFDEFARHRSPVGQILKTPPEQCPQISAIATLCLDPTADADLGNRENSAGGLTDRNDATRRLTNPRQQTNGKLAKCKNARGGLAHSHKPSRLLANCDYAPGSRNPASLGATPNSDLQPGPSGYR
jgi:hypothetical protein